MEEYQSILKEAGLSGNTGIHVSITAMLISLSQDAVVVQTKSDLNVYYEDGTTTLGTSAPPGVAASKLNYDINEWVGARLFCL